MKNADSVLEPVWSCKHMLPTIHLLEAGEQDEEESEGHDDDLDSDDFIDSEDYFWKI